MQRASTAEAAARQGPGRRRGTLRPLKGPGLLLHRRAPTTRPQSRPPTPAAAPAALPRLGPAGPMGGGARCVLPAPRGPGVGRWCGGPAQKSSQPLRPSQGCSWCGSGCHPPRGKGGGAVRLPHARSLGSEAAGGGFCRLGLAWKRLGQEKFPASSVSPLLPFLLSLLFILSAGSVAP